MLFYLLFLFFKRKQGFLMFCLPTFLKFAWTSFLELTLKEAEMKKLLLAHAEKTAPAKSWFTASATAGFWCSDSDFLNFTDLTLKQLHALV